MYCKMILKYLYYKIGVCFCSKKKIKTKQNKTKKQKKKLQIMDREIYKVIPPLTMGAFIFLE